jgi:hypothetical protein
MFIFKKWNSHENMTVYEKETKKKTTTTQQ